MNGPNPDDRASLADRASLVDRASLADRASVAGGQPRRKINLAELQRDLEQVAPVEAADFESLASAVSNLLNRDTQTVGRIEKKALWERVELEIERIETDGA